MIMVVQTAFCMQEFC